METRLVKINNMEESKKDMEEAAKLIREGELVAFPTETVYGLGGNGLLPDAAKKIYAAKGRPSDNPLILHVCDMQMVESLVKEIPDNARRAMEHFWPGPMTVILQKADQVPDCVTGGLDTVGIRLPDTQIARELIEAAGCPIAAPSANISGRPSPTKAQHVIDDLSGKIDAIVKGDDCRVGIESTVLDVTGDTPVILRPGIITAEQIEAVLDKKVEIDPAVLKQSTDGSLKPKAPGMKYKHYAPKADMVVIEGQRDKVKKEIERLKGLNEQLGNKVGVILFEEKAFIEAAHDFFARLRELDKENVDLILAGALSDIDGVGFAVMNRMLKSAGYNIVKV